MNEEIAATQKKFSIRSFKIISNFAAYNKNVNWLLFSLICCFTMGKLIDYKHIITFVFYLKISIIYKIKAPGLT